MTSSVIFVILISLCSFVNAAKDNPPKMLAIQPDAPRNSTESALLKPALESTKDDACRALVKEKCAWARWVILALGSLLVILCVVPFSFSACMQSQSRWFLVSVGALFCVCWIVFAFIADSSIFDTFYFISSTHIC